MNIIGSAVLVCDWLNRSALPYDWSDTTSVVADVSVTSCFCVMVIHSKSIRSIYTIVHIGESLSLPWGHWTVTYIAQLK